MITNLQNMKPGTRFRVHEMPGLIGVLDDCNECSAKVRMTSGPVDVEIAEPDGNVRRFTANRSRTTTWSPATVVETLTDDAAATSPPADDEPTCETCGAVTDRDHIGPICPACSEGNEEDEPMKTVTKAKKTKTATEPKARKPKATNVTKGGGGTRVRSSAKTTAVGAPELKEVTEPTITDDDQVLLPHPVTPEAKREHPKPAAKTKKSLLDCAVEILSDGKPRHCDDIIAEILKAKMWSTSGKTPAATLYSGMIREINGPGVRGSRFERTDTKGEFKIAGK